MIILLFSVLSKSGVNALIKLACVLVFISKGLLFSLQWCQKWDIFLLNQVTFELFFRIQGRNTLMMPMKNGHSVNGNGSDSGIGQSFFPPEFTAEAFASTPMASEPPLVQDCDLIQGHKQQFGRKGKFVIFWIFVAVPILVVQYGVEQFQKIKIIVKDRLEKNGFSEFVLHLVVCVFVISSEYLLLGP